MEPASQGAGVLQQQCTELVRCESCWLLRPLAFDSNIGGRLCGCGTACHSSRDSSFHVAAFPGLEDLRHQRSALLASAREEEAERSRLAADLAVLQVGNTGHATPRLSSHVMLCA